MNEKPVDVAKIVGMWRAMCSVDILSAEESAARAVAASSSV